MVKPAELDHESLVKDSFRNRAAGRHPTIATLGETPLENYEEEVAHFNIVATKIVSNAIQINVAVLLLKNKTVLLDPRFSECEYLF